MKKAIARTSRFYSREGASRTGEIATKSLHDYKFWPPIARVDNIFGDRTPVCSCVGMGNYS